MSAPDSGILYNFGDNFAQAGAAILNADGIPAFAVRLSQQLPKNRVDVEATGFARKSLQQSYTHQGIPFFNHFAGTIRTIIATQRATPEFAAKHGIWVGRIHWLFSQPAQKWTPIVLPYYEVLALVLVGTTTVEDEKRESDLTQCDWEVEFAIPPTAYPILAR